jgi:hypothetical protein
MDHGKAPEGPIPPGTGISGHQARLAIRFAMLFRRRRRFRVWEVALQEPTPGHSAVTRCPISPWIDLGGEGGG